MLANMIKHLELPGEFYFWKIFLTVILNYAKLL